MDDSCRAQRVTTEARADRTQRPRTEYTGAAAADHQHRRVLGELNQRRHNGVEEQFGAYFLCGCGFGGESAGNAQDLVAAIHLPSDDA